MLPKALVGKGANCTSTLSLNKRHPCERDIPRGRLSRLSCSSECGGPPRRSDMCGGFALVLRW